VHRCADGPDATRSLYKTVLFTFGLFKPGRMLNSSHTIKLTLEYPSCS